MHSAARLEIDADVSYLHTTHIQLPCLMLFQTVVVRDLAQDYYLILFLDYCHDV